MKAINVWACSNEAQQQWLKKWNHEHEVCFEKCSKQGKCFACDRMSSVCLLKREQDGVK